jgi:hypothetical protein
MVRAKQQRLHAPALGIALTAFAHDADSADGCTAAILCRSISMATPMPPMSAASGRTVRLRQGPPTQYPVDVADVHIVRTA